MPWGGSQVGLAIAAASWSSQNAGCSLPLPQDRKAYKAAAAFSMQGAYQSCVMWGNAAVACAPVHQAKHKPIREVPVQVAKGHADQLWEMVQVYLGGGVETEHGLGDLSNDGMPHHTGQPVRHWTSSDSPAWTA